MSVPDPSPVLTEHALLVPFGRFAQQIGLIEALGRVLVRMKTIVHSPGDKLAELVVHILAGGMHVKELETSPHPVVQDQTVAYAWGQDAFASGINALLRAVSFESVAALKEELQQVTAGTAAGAPPAAAGRTRTELVPTPVGICPRGTTPASPSIRSWCSPPRTCCVDFSVRSCTTARWRPSASRTWSVGTMITPLFVRNLRYERKGTRRLVRPA